MNCFEKDMLIKILNKQIEDVDNNITEIMELQKDIIETNLKRFKRRIRYERSKNIRKNN